MKVQTKYGWGLGTVTWVKRSLKSCLPYLASQRIPEPWGVEGPKASNKMAAEITATQMAQVHPSAHPSIGKTGSDQQVLLTL